MRRRRDRAGFSLIEALVALAIAAMTLTAIFQLQIQMARGQERAVEAMAQVTAQENAIALLRDLNPMAAPEGEIAIPEGDVIRWSSTPQGRPIINAGFPAGNGMFEVQRFTVRVDIERRAGRPAPPLTFDRMGWRRLGGADPLSDDF